MITCVVEYVIDPAEIEVFERFARRWMELVELHGGSHHGYFLPAEGASDRALALFSFPSLAAYEQYRELFGKDPDFVAADRIRDESGCAPLPTDIYAPTSSRALESIGWRIGSIDQAVAELKSRKNDLHFEAQQAAWMGLWPHDGCQTGPAGTGALHYLRVAGDSATARDGAGIPGHAGRAVGPPTPTALVTPWRQLPRIAA